MSYGLHGVDVKLLKYLNFTDGVFIEAGANDGISQSNTYIFERGLGWKGLLVEPNSIKASICRKNRPNSIVENVALVSDTYTDTTIKGDFNQPDWGESLSGMVIDSGDWTTDSIEFERRFKENQRSEFIVQVPVSTLTSILEKYNFSKIDLFSLDVEGYEISVLGGLDFTKFRPTYIMVETGSDIRKSAMEDFLTSKGYTFVEELSDLDDLYTDSNTLS